MFGEFIKKLRFKQQLGLREFCLTKNHDPSNWSKVEREILPPPRDEETLSKWASDLGIEAGSEDWKKFFDFAALDAGMLPKYIVEDKELVEKLPVFFRTLEGKKPSPEDLDKLVQLLRKA